MDSITRYLPSHMKLATDQNLNLPAIIAGIDEALSHVDDFLEEAQKQLFFPTASSKYLKQIASSKGFFLQRNSGINVDGFRKIAALVALAPKQSYGTLVQILQAFYSLDFVKPSIISTQAGPYSLMPGDTLIVRSSEIEYTVTLPAGIFPDFEDVSAASLSSYLNSAQDDFGVLTYNDRMTGLSHIQLVAGAYGPSASIQVVGGTAASIFRFSDYHTPLHATDTKLLVTKPASHSDEVTFTWDAVLPDPAFYRLTVGDFVTFRNLFDVATSGAQSVADTDEWGYADGTFTARNLVSGNYSILNNTFEVFAIGLNFFKIRVPGFFPASNSGNIYLRSARDLLLQRNKAHKLYEQQEYALISETTPNTVTVVVPAVPPIVKRYVEGAWHIHGAISTVSAITRNSITMTANTVDFPDVCSFTLKSPKILETSKTRYQTSSRAVDTWTLSSSGTLFPYTTAQWANLDTTTPFNCPLNSDLVTVTVKDKHFLTAGQTVTFSLATVVDGFNMNTTLPVVRNDGAYQFTVRTPTPYTGAVTAQKVSIVRLPAIQADGSNAYIQFAASPSTDLVDSGILPGTRVKLAIDGTTVVSDVVGAFQLQQGYMGVVSENTALRRLYINALTSLGTSTVVSNAPLRRAIERFGGSPKYFMDTTNAVNMTFYSDLTAIMADAAPHDNVLFRGTYLYDTYATFTLSQNWAQLSSPVFSGSADVFITLNSNASTFIQSGYIVVGYGTSEQEGPIRFTSVYQSGSTYEMRLDPTYVFVNTHSIGTQVAVVGTMAAPTIDIQGLHYQPYITGIAEARNTLFDILRDIVAAGVFVEEEVIYPQLRNEDPMLTIYD